MKLLLLLFPLCVLLTSCSEDPSKLEAKLNASTWNLAKLTVDGKNVDLSASPLEDRTLQFFGGRAAGSVGLNSFQITFKIKDPDSLSPTQDGGGMTEMAGPPEIMELENTCLAALWNVRKAEITAETLTLSGKGVEFIFQGMPAPPIAPGNPEDTVTNTNPEE